MGGVIGELGEKEELWEGHVRSGRSQVRRGKVGA